LSTHLCLGFRSELFSSGIPTQILYAFLVSPMRATCPVHLILLDLTILIIHGEDDKLLESNKGFKQRRKWCSRNHHSVQRRMILCIVLDWHFRWRSRNYKCS
jgi:hypothetical protein